MAFFTTIVILAMGQKQIPPKLLRFMYSFWITIWLFNIAMENGPFIDGSPINSMVIFHGYVSHNQMLPNSILKSPGQKLDTRPGKD